MRHRMQVLDHGEPTFTWRKAQEHAKYYREQAPIDFGTNCVVCQCANYVKCWAICPTCTKPVIHLKCLRQYVVSSQFGALKCPACGIQPIAHHDGRQTLFPIGWSARYVKAIHELSSDPE